MNTDYPGIRKLKQIANAVWLITFLVAAFSYRFIKGAVVFILTELYKFVIQQKPAE